MTIQSILFKKTIYHTRGSAKRWVVKNKYLGSIRPDPNPESLNFWRFRQRQPEEFKPDSFYIKRYNNSIYFVIGQLK